jgi:hypothetical protein
MCRGLSGIACARALRKHGWNSVKISCRQTSVSSVTKLPSACQREQPTHFSEMNTAVSPFQLAPILCRLAALSRW